MPTTTLHDAKQNQLKVQKESKTKRVRMFEGDDKEKVEEKKNNSAKKVRNNYDTDDLLHSEHLLLSIIYSVFYVVIYMRVFSVVTRKDESYSR